MPSCCVQQGLAWVLEPAFQKAGTPPPREGWDQEAEDEVLCPRGTKKGYLSIAQDQGLKTRVLRASPRPSSARAWLWGLALTLTVAPALHLPLGGLSSFLGKEFAELAWGALCILGGVAGTQAHTQAYVFLPHCSYCCLGWLCLHSNSQMRCDAWGWETHTPTRVCGT